MPLEYVRRIRLINSWLYEEIQYRSELKESLTQLKEHLEWIEIQLDKDLFIISNFLQKSLEQQVKLDKDIYNIELDIEYTTSRIKYYKKISKITSTLG